MRGWKAIVIAMYDNLVFRPSGRRVVQFFFSAVYFLSGSHSIFQDLTSAGCPSSLERPCSYQFGLQISLFRLCRSNMLDSASRWEC